MDSLQLDPETVDNLDAYNHIPPQLMEKCAALSVRPDTVRNLVQSMQGEYGAGGGHLLSPVRQGQRFPPPPAQHPPAAVNQHPRALWLH